MIDIEIVSLRKEKPSEITDFKVDRSSDLGNPFPLGNERRRDMVCDDYDQYIRDKIVARDDKIIKALNKIYAMAVIYGKARLFCWCAPKRCHAETIRTILLEWDK